MTAGAPRGWLRATSRHRATEALSQSRSAAPRRWTDVAQRIKVGLLPFETALMS
jgi:hypothetical protein